MWRDNLGIFGANFGQKRSHHVMDVPADFRSKATHQQLLTKAAFGRFLSLCVTPCFVMPRFAAWQGIGAQKHKQFVLASSAPRISIRGYGGMAYIVWAVRVCQWIPCVKRGLLQKSEGGI